MYIYMYTYIYILCLNLGNPHTLKIKLNMQYFKRTMWQKSYIPPYPSYIHPVWISDHKEPHTVVLQGLSSHLLQHYAEGCNILNSTLQPTLGRIKRVGNPIRHTTIKEDQHQKCKMWIRNWCWKYTCCYTLRFWLHIQLTMIQRHNLNTIIPGSTKWAVILLGRMRTLISPPHPTKYSDTMN